MEVTAMKPPDSITTAVDWAGVGCVSAGAVRLLAYFVAGAIPHAGAARVLGRPRWSVPVGRGFRPSSQQRQPGGPVGPAAPLRRARQHTGRDPRGQAC